jgi:protein-tyrosine phosphatase
LKKKGFERETTPVKVVKEERNSSKKKVLFICAGNICRSPMAEGIFNALCRKKNLPYRAESRGVGNWHAGEPATREVLLVLKKHRYGEFHHTARQISLEDKERFHLFLAVDRYCLMESQRILSAPPPEIHLFLPFVGLSGEVPDPYGGDMEVYEETFYLVEEGVKKLIEKLQKGL